MNKLSILVQINIEATEEPSDVANDIEQAIDELGYDVISCTPFSAPPSGAAAPQTPLVVPPTQQTTT